MMLKNASLRFLQDGAYRLPPRTLSVGYSESVLPLIRKFCSVPIERITDRKGNDEFQGQDAADMPLGNSDNNSESCHTDGSTCAMRNGLEKLGPKKPHETKHNMSAPQVSQEAHYHGKKLPDKALQPCLLQVVLHTPASALKTILDKWVEDGNRLETNDLLSVYSNLKKRRRRRKAFQFVEWVERGELLKFAEHDYAYHLRTLARYKGIEAAQKYIERVPKSFRNQLLYETLLANCVRRADIQKAEKVFKEIRSLSLPLTVSACNKMLILYRRLARKKVKVALKKVDYILMIIEKENVKPSPFTYKLLIDFKGLSNDISGMEAVVDRMKVDGVELDFSTQSMIAKFYMDGGFTDKAEGAIRAMEVHVNDKRRAIRSLLPMYACLRRPDDVARIWKLCTEPKSSDYLSAIKAWGTLGHIEQAEETFDTMLNSRRKLTSTHFNAMLNVYAENKLLSKSVELLERMHSAGCPSDHLTWDAIVNLYVNSGEEKKADSFLLNEAEENADRSQLFCLCIKLLKACAEKGDIHNAVKIFDRLKKVMYAGRAPPYNLLLEAYVNAFSKRMRSHKVLPSKRVMEKLNYLKNLQKGGKTERGE